MRSCAILGNAFLRCRLTMMGRLKQDQRQSVRSRPDAVLIQIVALYQWRPSIRAKAVVDAELHSGDGLLDVNPWHNFGASRPQEFAGEFVDFLRRRGPRHPP